MPKQNENTASWVSRIEWGKCNMARLAEIIIGVIGEGLLLPHDPIPSLSSFAELSGMSENSVRETLTGPLLEGYLYRVQGSGTFVSPDAPCFRNRPNYFAGNPDVPLHALASAESFTASSCLLGIERPGTALFKNHRFNKYVNAERRHQGGMDQEALLQLYRDTTLATEMRAHLNQRRRLQLEDAHFTLRYHYADTLLRLVQVLSGPHDHIICTEPTPPWLRQVLCSKGGQLLAADTAPEDLFLENLQQQLRTGRVRLLYINTRCSRSNSHTLSPEALQQVLDLCLQHRVTILEEDSQHEFWYEESPFTPLAAHDHRGHVVYLSPFSQLNRYLGSLWQVAAAPVIIEKLRQCPENIVRLADLEKDRALVSLLQSREWNAVLAHARTEARNNRDFICRLIDNYLHQRLVYAEPKAGLVVYAHMKDGSEAAAFLGRLAAQGIQLPCIPKARPGKPSGPSIRLGFGVSFNRKSEQEFKKIRDFLDQERYR